MKKEDLIKLGLDEETAKKAEKASLDELKEYVPKVTFDDANAGKLTLEKTLKERDSQLETLKNSTGDIDGLKEQIKTLQADNKAKETAHAEEIKQLKINTAVESALSLSKAKNHKAVKALLDLEKAELSEDGTVKGLDDQIKKLIGAEDSKFLFDADSKKTAFRGAKPSESGVELLDKKVDTSKMTYEEIAAYIEQNPDAEI